MSEYNSDELYPPSWMNETFFEDVLRKSENNDTISVKSLKMSPASLKGDHYASIMFRALLTYDTSESIGLSKSMIIKTMPEVEGHKKDLLQETFIFETEIGMYSKTIPKFEEELRKVGDNTVLGAKALYYSLEPRKCIVFEDITEKGYETIRDRMASMEETKASLLKLAKWHAVSYKLASEGDESVTSYSESFFNTKDIESVPFMTTGIENFIAKLETIDELKKFVPHLKKVQKDLLKKCIASSKAYRVESPKGIFVLNHGDFHSKNMMFKRNEKNGLEDVMLIDFQMCFFGPAIFDVIYGIYTLLEPQSRLNNFDEVMYFYCSSFIDTLKMLKFQGEIPKISDFYIEMLRHRHFEIFLMSSFLPMWYGLDEKITDDPDDLLNSPDVRKQIYDSPNYLNDVKQALPSLFYRGYLE